MDQAASEPPRPGGLSEHDSATDGTSRPPLLLVIIVVLLVTVFVVLHLTGVFGPGLPLLPTSERATRLFQIAENQISDLIPLAELSDERLATVPPASEMRFADGRRTLEQIIVSLLNHQRHQCDALAAAGAGSDTVA